LRASQEPEVYAHFVEQQHAAAMSYQLWASIWELWKTGRITDF